MSIAISWMPLKNEYKRFQSDYGYREVELIRNIFGATINDDEIPRLNHYAEATGHKLWLEIIEILERHGTIQIKEDY